MVGSAKTPTNHSAPVEHAKELDNSNSFSRINPVSPFVKAFNSLGRKIGFKGGTEKSLSLWESQNEMFEVTSDSDSYEQNSLRVRFDMSATVIYEFEIDSPVSQSEESTTYRNNSPIKGQQDPVEVPERIPYSSVVRSNLVDASQQKVRQLNSKPAQVTEDAKEMVNNEKDKTSAAKNDSYQRQKIKEKLELMKIERTRELEEIDSVDDVSSFTESISSIEGTSSTFDTDSFTLSELSM
jgi:E3 ubiquitin-protein ligase DOA10